MSVTLYRNFQITDPKKVNAIKALRIATNKGLKETKQLVDQAETGQPVVVHISGVDTKAQLSLDLMHTGYAIAENKINDFEEKYGEPLRQTASIAILSGDDSFATDLLSIIEKYTIRT